MQLLDWMKREGYDDEAIAARINERLPNGEHCSGAAVRKWKYRERQPDAAKMQRIHEISGGEVSLVDWASERTEAV